MATPQVYSSVAALAQQTGVAVRTAANLPVDLNDPACIWYVERGAVDVFLTERKDGVDVAAPQHVLHAEARRLLMGVAPEASGSDFNLVAKGHPDTLLRRLPAAALHQVDSSDVAEQVDAWLAGVSAMLFERNELPVSHDVLVEQGKVVEEAQGTLKSSAGVVWVPDTGLYMGIVEGALVAQDASDAVIPLTPDSWLTLFDTTRIAGRSSEDLVRAGILLEALSHFHAVAFASLSLDRSLAQADDANLQRDRAKTQHTEEYRARLDLYHLLSASRETVSDSELFSVLTLIGRHEGIKFRKPSHRSTMAEPASLADILDISGVRCRRVRLLPEENWWHGDSGAILGFRTDSGQPVALLPQTLGSYREVDASGRQRVGVTAERARGLDPQGFMFYRPLPGGRATATDLVKLIRSSLSGGGVARFGTAGLTRGLVMLLPAVLIGLIADTIIPTGDDVRLYQAVTLLVGFAILGALLHIIQGTGLMRMEGRVTARVEAALWDRMLRLPTKFMRRYPAGDLATRGMTLQALRDSISGVVADAMLSVVFLFPAFALMIYHDAVMGAVGALMGFLTLAIMIVLGLRQLPYHRLILTAQRRLTAKLFQFIEGIAKVRSCSAERSAFAQWAQQYHAQKTAEIRLHNLNVHLLAVSTMLPVLTIAAILAIAEPDTASVGDFLVVISAFMIFQMALLRLGASFSAVAAIIPAYEQILPLLHEASPSGMTGASVERLSGEITFDQVSFRYDPDGPLVIDDVSIHIRPGEFVAITGASGSGKSTLLRLALGLETPVSGTVYYDGRDIKGLNLKQLRRKIGVVPQETTLMPEDIWDNIVSDDALATEEAVWQAARLAIVDQDIPKMPMGLYTSVGHSASTLSGGESQRIMIAGALYDNPRIVMLDEATNWLDNENQAKVMRSVESLPSSKLVIAHRLSTLQQADRIYVMQRGKVVQEGTFEGLVEVEGVFRDLVRRQMT